MMHLISFSLFPIRVHYPLSIHVFTFNHPIVLAPYRPGHSVERTAVTASSPSHLLFRSPHTLEVRSSTTCRASYFGNGSS